MKPHDDDLITLPLKTLVKYILGDGYWHDRPIDETTAQIILAKTKNKRLCYVQHADEISPHLKGPVLWDMTAWQTAVERYNRMKVWAANERVRRNILDANVAMVARMCKQELAMDDDFATATAYSLVTQNNKNKLLAIGISKLYVKESEIP